MTATKKTFAYDRMREKRKGKEKTGGCLVSGLFFQYKDIAAGGDNRLLGRTYVQILFSSPEILH